MELVAFFLRQFIRLVSDTDFPVATDYCPSIINYSLLLQFRYEEIISDSAYLDRVLAEGATKAAEIADATLGNVYQAMGFLRR